MVTLPYAPDAKNVLLAAFSAQRDWNHLHLHPEHLLWGVLEVDADSIKLAPKLRKALVRWVESEANLPSGHKKGKYNWSDAAQAILSGARQAASSIGSDEIEPHHILVALASDESELGEMIRGFGVKPVEITLDAAEFEASTDVVLSDDSSEPYYLQIVGQIKQGIAEGRLIPGEKLKTVRQLADALQIAPGTVARAYRILQEEGVIVTDRSKGTTVAVPQFSSSGSEDTERVEALIALLRPTAVAAYHMGSSLDELLKATRLAAEGVFE